MKFIIPSSFVLFTLLTILFHSCDENQDEQLIVWSVGQGQMVTYVTPLYCHHFDMGGEFFPKQKLFNICKSKKNRVKYSHWDYDHINFSIKVKQILPSLCRAHKKSYLPQSKKKKKMIEKIPPCKLLHIPSIREIPLPKKAHPKTSNEFSRIYVIKDKILIPGDSNDKMEFFWSSLIQTSIKILILGHHGSFSSTSTLLLKKLSDLRLAIASARRKRYNHPHPLTITRLKKQGILTITTEDFKHIQIFLNKKTIQAFPLY